VFEADGFVYATILGEGVPGPLASATAVAHARTVRIGPAHECGIFEVGGFVYATILGEGVPC
jgi:hypothetical protein